MNFSQFLRTFKATYVVNNLLNASKLKHNRALFRRYGLQKSIFSPLSSKDFQALPPQDVPWLDQPDAREKALADPRFQEFPLEQQAQILRWIEEGYVILRGFFSPEKIQAINAEVDRLIEERAVRFNHSERILFAYRQSALLKEVVNDPDLIRLMSFLLGKPMEPFQSLNFLEGSQQMAHSDSIHMTTFPLGYLSAIWLALETIGPDNGPLFYYPGSHRLPYVLNDDFPHGGNALRVGEEANERYEEAIQAVVDANKLEKSWFHAEAGDLLIWHANLLHGGEPIHQLGSTRKSMVIHYFAREVICYHELTQRPALLPLQEEV